MQVLASDTPSVPIGSMTSIELHSVTEDKDRVHCRAMSSDDDSLCEDESDKGKPKATEAATFSSGYSSVHSASPSSPSSSSSSPSPLMPCTFNTFSQASAKAQSGFRLLVPMQRPRGLSSKQVKRKNFAAHSGGEVEDEEEGGDESNAGFLSL